MNAATPAALLPLRRFLAVGSLVLLFGITACATRPATTSESSAAPAGSSESTPAETPDETYDPFERFNRAMYTFNEKLDGYVLKPVAKGYRAITPGPVRQGVSNFFGNLREPMVMINDALQGKFKAAASDLGRFLTNSTLGVLGIFDVATRFGLEKRNEDFGQTLAVWGVAEGPYLVLPLFGPSSVRDGAGLAGDYFTYPPTYMEETSTAWKLFATDIIDARTRYLDAGDILEQATGAADPYIFVREAYRQRRQSLTRDGEALPVDPSIFEEDAPRPAAKPAAPTPP